MLFFPYEVSAKSLKNEIGLTLPKPETFHLVAQASGLRKMACG
jgi:hypothetical protein